MWTSLKWVLVQTFVCDKLKFLCILLPPRYSTSFLVVYFVVYRVTIVGNKLEMFSYDIYVIPKKCKKQNGKQIKKHHERKTCIFLSIFYVDYKRRSFLDCSIFSLLAFTFFFKNYKLHLYLKLT